MPDQERRRVSPPCDVHGHKIDENESAIHGLRLTLYGEEGTGGMSKRLTLIENEAQNTIDALNGMKKVLYPMLITIMLSIFGMLTKVIFF